MFLLGDPGRSYPISSHASHLIHPIPSHSHHQAALKSALAPVNEAVNEAPEHEAAENVPPSLSAATA